MWNRLSYLCWIFVLLLLAGNGVGSAHAGQRPLHSEHMGSTTVIPGENFNKFAGIWTAHGALMLVSDDGNVRFIERTYNWCGSDATPPCDSIEHNRILDGYQEQLMLTSTTDSVAEGTVVSSNNPSAQPGVAFTLALGPDNTLIYANQNKISTTRLCGPAAPAGTCGA